jgi:hypothetical protein
MELKPCDRCRKDVPGPRHLWTTGIGIDPKASWELCGYCHDEMMDQMQYGAGAA